MQGTIQQKRTKTQQTNLPSITVIGELQSPSIAFTIAIDCSHRRYFGHVIQASARRQRLISSHSETDATLTPR
jgi:hypothetical protein